MRVLLACGIFGLAGLAACSWITENPTREPSREDWLHRREPRDGFLLSAIATEFIAEGLVELLPILAASPSGSALTTAQTAVASRGAVAGSYAFRYSVPVAILVAILDLDQRGVG